ncbi:LysR family transcriptional regulator [Methylobacterium sp. Leaf104]|uniref:LysR family transcriptional regulator n=1 Tax=Methylobacterium TaxID=407 RepID=UPI0006FD70D2|nr:LysR family transcriptional regulator [Methylobacterium sp. Leaf104]KQP41476.1 LysR family transcriptional regulator [Methylobacterium sp. Leaf104]MCI9881539.1 LysR family transcriptional regulator [Methylobacterium goesingense]
MELKWLEDFLSLAQTRSFSRSAEARHVTQSAFSRRIRALELWLGVNLVDRSTYPTTLTPEGRRFRDTAEESVRALLGARADLRAGLDSAEPLVRIAGLHTLALTFFPAWLRTLAARTGPVATRLLPDDFHDCLQALVEGGSDFLLTFHHPGVPIPLDPELYPHRVVGADALVPVRGPALDEGGPLPRLDYGRDSFLGRVSLLAQAELGLPPGPVVHANPMAEALKCMALEGHGLAFVPRSLVTRELAEGRLVAAGPEIPLEIRLYRNGAKAHGPRARAAVAAIWAAAEAG